MATAAGWMSASYVVCVLATAIGTFVLGHPGGVSRAGRQSYRSTA